MKRVALYSSSRRSQSLIQPGGVSPPGPIQANDHPLETVSPSTRPPFLPNFFRRHRSLSWSLAAGSAALLLAWAYMSMIPAPRQITQKDINRAVLHTLETQPLPSPAAKAYDDILPSVERVRGMVIDPVGDGDVELNLGSVGLVAHPWLIPTHPHS